MPSQIYQKNVLFMYGVLGALQSAASVFFLWQIPSANAVIWGLSFERLVMVGGILVVCLGFLMLSWGVWQNSGWFEKMQSWISQIQQPKVWGIMVLSSIFLLICGSFFTLITPEITEPFAQAYFVRLQPLALLVAGIAAQTLLALPIIRHGADWRQKLFEHAEFTHTFLIYGLFLLAAGGIKMYLSSIEPDPVGWNTLGTPLLDTQVLTVFLVGIILVGLSLQMRKRADDQPISHSSSNWKLDGAICLILWIAAAWYWSSLPLNNNWYVSAPRYPTHSYYPNSDGVVYDTTARSLLTGMGYQSSHLPYPRRPMYDLFLFGLYLIQGEDYQAVVSLQAVLLGALPALIYLTVKNMHSRLAGIIAGTLVLLREGNAIALTGVVTVSHSKMAMSDIPTALGVVLFTWVALHWLNAPKNQRWIITAGGILAALMHIRIETGVFIPVVFGLALFRLRQLKTRYLASLFAFVGCMILVLTPWVYRNWKTTGLIYLEVPDARLGFLLYRLQLTTEDEAPQVPTPEEGGQNHTPRQKTRPVVSAQTTPPSFPEIMANHWIHSLSQAVLIFPNTYRLFDSSIGLLGHRDPTTFWTQCCSGRDYVKRLPFWEWGTWSGQIPPQSIVPILVNLLILAVGFRQAWKTLRWNALLPVGMAFVYYFANALARTSGGRYLLPVEWVWITYYSVGLAYLATGVFRLFGIVPESALVNVTTISVPTSTNEIRTPWKSSLAICIGFLLLGIAIPAAEKLIPPRYTADTLKTWLDSTVWADDHRQLAPYLKELFNNGGTVLQGQANYLRYYSSDQGEPGSLYPAVYPRPFPRLSIFLVGPTGIGVYLPVADRPEIQAENAADVLVFGCPQAVEKGPYFDALAMYFPATDELFLRAPYPETFTCPLPDP